MNRSSYQVFAPPAFMARLPPSTGSKVPGDHSRGIRGKKDRRSDNISRLADAIERNAGEETRNERVRIKTRIVNQCLQGRGPKLTGQNCVDANLVGCPLQSEPRVS